jgi:hypothetical protein
MVMGATALQAFLRATVFFACSAIAIFSFGSLNLLGAAAAGVRENSCINACNQRPSGALD